MVSRFTIYGPAKLLLVNIPLREYASQYWPNEGAKGDQVRDMYTRIIEAQKTAGKEKQENTAAGAFGKVGEANGAAGQHDETITKETAKKETMAEEAEEA